MEDQINDPDSLTFQIIDLGSFFDGTNWHVWLLQLMTTKCSKKTYW